MDGSHDRVVTQPSPARQYCPGLNEYPTAATRGTLAPWSSWLWVTTVYTPVCGRAKNQCQPLLPGLFQVPGQKFLHNLRCLKINRVFRSNTFANYPTQCGRKPDFVSEPATGFICANLVPQGNPSDPSYGLPLLDKVDRAIARVTTVPRLHLHSVAGALGVHDQALHQRGMLPVGIPKTIEPMNPAPSPEDIRDILNEAGLHRKRTPHQAQLACVGRGRGVDHEPCG